MNELENFYKFIVWLVWDMDENIEWLYKRINSLSIDEIKELYTEAYKIAKDLLPRA